MKTFLKISACVFFLQIMFFALVSLTNIGGGVAYLVYILPFALVNNLVADMPNEIGRWVFWLLPIIYSFLLGGIGFLIVRKRPMESIGTS